MQAFVGLGTNVGDLRANLVAALDGLERSGQRLVAASSIWNTAPVDTREPYWFLNMVVELDTEQQPLELLDLLLALERRAGRERAERNGPRILDLDLLWMGGRIVDEPRLRLPHPRMWERRFVLEPLAELAPQLVNPQTGRPIQEERHAAAREPVVRKLGSLPWCDAYFYNPAIPWGQPGE